MSSVMIRNFPGRRARLSFVMLMFVLVGLAVFLALDLRSRHQWADETLEQIQPRYARLAGLIQSEAKIRSALENTLQSFSAYVYPVETPADRVGTDLQQRARGVAEAAGLSVLNSRILPVRATDGLEIVALVITVQGDAAQLRTMLVALPDEQPTIQIEGANIQAARGRAAQSALTAQLTLSVIRLPA